MHIVLISGARLLSLSLSFYPFFGIFDSKLVYNFIWSWMLHHFYFSTFFRMHLLYVVLTTDMVHGLRFSFLPLHLSISLILLLGFFFIFLFTYFDFLLVSSSSFSRVCLCCLLPISFDTELRIVFRMQHISYTFK